MLGNIIGAMEDRKRDLEQGVFQMPPSDWPAFQRRLGEWVGLQNAIDALNQALEEENNRD